MIRSQFAADAWRGGAWPRQATAAIAEAACHQHDASPAQRQAAAILADPKTVVVITGQQPALGGGLLYSLIKAAQMVALAGALREQGLACVPVFWCASEDHDAGEADHADLVHADGRLQRMRTRWPRPGASSRFQPASAGWQELLTAANQLPGSLGAAWLRQLTPADNEDLGTWCCRLLSQTFAQHPLVCVQAHQLRPLWQEHITRIERNWPSAALASRRQVLLDSGHPDSFGSDLARPPWFDDDAGGRVAITDPTSIPAERLSTGAALRPIIQQLVFPAAAAVLGPGERAYHDFPLPAYEACGAQPPHFRPRHHICLLSSRLQRACQAWDILPETITPTSPAPKQPTPLDLSALDLAIAALPDDDIRLRVGKARLQRERQRLATSLARQQRQREQKPPFEAIRQQLFPRGKAQERVMSLFQALWEHGPGLADQLVAYCRDHPEADGFLRL